MSRGLEEDDVAAVAAEEQTDTDDRPGRPAEPRLWRLKRLLCVLQVIAALVALALVFWEVESILATCPVLAALGLLLALLALPTGSRLLMSYALSAPLLTSLIALLISANEWRPGEAEAPCAMLLSVYAVLVVPWGAATVARLGKAAREPTRGPDTPLQFSLKTVLVAMSVSCVLLAGARLLTWIGEMGLFATYGIGVLLITAALGVWFERRRAAAASYV